MNFFVNVGELAEAHNHHPEFLSNFRKKIKVKLIKPDVNGLTDKDFKLAIEIDQLVSHEFLNILDKNK